MCLSAAMSAINPAWYDLEAKQTKVVRGRHVYSIRNGSGKWNILMRRRTNASAVRPSLQ